jgi:hypothetical protein
MVNKKNIYPKKFSKKIYYIFLKNINLNYYLIYKILNYLKSFYIKTLNKISPDKYLYNKQVLLVINPFGVEITKKPEKLFLLKFKDNLFNDI